VLTKGGTEYLSDEEAAAMSANFLFDELGSLARQPVKLAILVQMAEPVDNIADASTTWPANRTEIPFGTITLTARVDEQAPEQRKIIFDRSQGSTALIPRVTRSPRYARTFTCSAAAGGETSLATEQNMPDSDPGQTEIASSPNSPRAEHSENRSLGRHEHL